MAYDEMEKRILEAAARLLIRYGYDKTTLDDVTREAGLSRSTLYTRWKKKDTLFQAVIWSESIRYVDDLIQRLENNIEAGTLVGFFRLVMDLMRESAFMSALYTRERHIMGALLLHDNMAQLYTWRISSTASFIGLLQQVGMMRPEVDAQTLAFVLSSLQLGILKMSEVIPHEQSPPFERVMQETVDMLNAYASPADVRAETGHAALMTYMRALRDQINAIRGDALPTMTDKDT